MLMPTVYQLVPGSLIARLWFNAIFPPKPIEMTMSTTTAAGVAVNYTAFKEDVQHTVIMFRVGILVAAFLAVRVQGHASMHLPPPRAWEVSDDIKNSCKGVVGRIST